MIVTKLDLRLVLTEGVDKFLVKLHSLFIVANAFCAEHACEAAAIFNVLFEQSYRGGLNSVIGVVVGFDKFQTLVEYLIYSV